ncbi:phosphotransferase enzyme family protein [Candidatus Bipolaricaulota bacterium]
MNTPFPVTYSTVSAKALADKVLPAYGLDVVDLRLYQGGFNDTYVAKTGGGDTFFVRVYCRGWRTREDALCELDALDHLRQKAISAAYPLSRTDGGFLSDIDAPEGERSVAVFPEAKGRMLAYEEDSTSLCKTYGTAVAAMHNAWDDFSSPHERFHLDLAHLIDRPLEFVKPVLGRRPEDLKYVQRFAAAVRQQIAEIPEIEQAYCHGDLQGFHAHMDEEGVLTFYDFDCGGFGYRAYDLAVFRWSARFDDAEAPRWEAFLEAYRNGRSISDADIAAVPLFVCARHIWHMGVHAENAPHWGYGGLNDAYYDRRIEWLRALAADYRIEV